MDNNNNAAAPETESAAQQKFCKHCGGKIAAAAVICPLCGCQVEEIKETQNVAPQIVINNANTNSNVNTNTNVNGGVPARARNKWVAFAVC